MDVRWLPLHRRWRRHGQGSGPCPRYRECGRNSERTEQLVAAGRQVRTGLQTLQPTALSRAIVNSQPSRRLFFPRIPRPDKMSKRSASPPPAQGTLIKRSRSSEPQNTSQLIISSSGKGREQALIRTVKRTSNLEAPIVSLSGAHGVSVGSFGNAVG